MRGLAGGMLLLAGLILFLVGGAISPQDSSTSDTLAVEQVRERQPAPAAAPGVSPEPSGRPAPADRPPADDPVLPLPADAQEAVIDRHIDGDTLALRALAVGPVLSSTSQITVRLLEIDTPETTQPGTSVQCYGPEASARLAALAPVDTRVYVAADRERTDQYGRDLLYLWDAQGRSINLSLVDGGFAKAVLYAPNDRYITVLRAAEAEAKTARRGLWGACAAPVPAPAAAVVAPAPVVQPPAAVTGNCDPAYPSVCIAPPLPDLDCGEIPHRRFAVRAPDPHNFDGDSDGVGCESG
ncbi:MAG: thermonuclease family protein [Actinomycetota bacterium]|nr:thermonuclease family protein [Actinomycetota bacterium]